MGGHPKTEKGIMKPCAKSLVIVCLTAKPSSSSTAVPMDSDANSAKEDRGGLDLHDVRTHLFPKL